MGFFNRLKRLWELSGEPEGFKWTGQIEAQPASPDTKYVQVYPTPIVTKTDVSSLIDSIVEAPRPRGQATVVQDDPLDIFPSDENESEQPGG